MSKPLCNQRKRPAASIRDCSKSLRAPWESGTSIVPEVCDLVRLKGSRPTNSCDCKRKFARAYAVLQRHSQDCLLCRIGVAFRGT